MKLGKARGLAASGSLALVAALEFASSYYPPTLA
jgi:hypothetical protein